MTSTTPVKIVEEFLLTTPGLSDRDIFFIQKNVEIRFSQDGGEVILRRIPVHLQEEFSIAKEDQINKWIRGLRHGVASQIREATVRLTELGAPCEEVWLPRHWVCGMTCQFLDLKIEVWERNTIRVVSDPVHGKFTEVPFDFERMGIPE
jgi:hypothetical protein